MRLGTIERAILVACLWKRQRSGRPQAPFEPDIQRDDLPGLLWGWERLHPYLAAQPGMYYYCSRAEYRVKQAALTRALQTLYAKQLIDAGGRGEATGLQVYSVRRAARLGLDAALPRDEAAMNTLHIPLRYPGGPPDPRHRPWTRVPPGRSRASGATSRACA